MKQTPFIFILLLLTRLCCGQNDTIIYEQKAYGEQVLMSVKHVELKRKYTEEDFYSKEYQQFLRTRKIYDFDILDWTD